MSAGSTVHRDRPLFAIGLRLLAMIMLAVTYVISKLLSERGAHIAEITFYRQLFAFPIAAIWGFATIGTLVLKPRAPMAMHWRRTIMGFTGMFFNFGAVALLPLAEATSIGFTVQVNNLSQFTPAVRASLIVIDSRGNSSAAATADFSQADQGGPGLTLVDQA